MDHLSMSIQTDLAQILFDYNFVYKYHTYSSFFYMKPNLELVI